jgi:hypothetical protein
VTRRFIVTVWLAAFTPAYGQLHLITGSPTPKYNQSFSSVLFRVENDRTVKPIAELVPQNVGTAWISISYDLKKAVLLSERITFLDLDKASVAKSCALPHAPSNTMGFVDQWLMDAPSRGTVFVEEFADGPRSIALQGVTADPSMPCDKSVLTIDPSELNFVVLHGYSGVADVGSPDSILVFLDASGRMKRRWVGGGETDFGYNIPLELLSGIAQPYTAIVSNNHELLTVSVTDRTSDQERLLVLRKSDKTWHRLPIPTERIYWQRGFGKFISIAEAKKKRAQTPESAGRAEWRKTESKMGPSIHYRLQDADFVFPGRLHLYNIDTERVYTIHTNQADSEVLLVEDNTVFYRVTDRLYAASITEKGLGAARLLATDEAIRDAHWAFIKH